MRHELAPLPFPENALEPRISKETLQYHHGKHHRGYVNKLNQLVQGTEFEQLPLEEIVRRSQGPLFNNAGQAWNHAFFWNCLSPDKTRPEGGLLSALESDFGSVEEFESKFVKAAADVFGSGWAWLVRLADGKLVIETTANAMTPLVDPGKSPILTCDVWEHAYYIDYRNDRARYLDALRSLLNWEFGARNFGSAARAAA